MTSILDLLRRADLSKANANSRSYPVNKRLLMLFEYRASLLLDEHIWPDAKRQSMTSLRSWKNSTFLT